MKNLILLSSLLLVFNCSSISQTNRNEIAESDPFSIISFEINLVKIKYITTGTTTAIPPHTIRRADSYIYDLVFKLSFRDDLKTRNAHIYVNLEKADNVVELLNYNAELYQLTDNIFPEYVTQVEAKKKGTIRATLGYLDVNGEVLFDKTNPLRTRIVTLK